MNHSHETYANDHRHTESTPSGAAPGASGDRFACPMHPEIVRDAPGSCPKCGMTLIPIFEAIPRASVLLRHDAQHRPGPRIRLQRARHPGCGRRALPTVFGLLLSPIFDSAAMALN